STGAQSSFSGLLGVFGENRVLGFRHAGHGDGPAGGGTVHVDDLGHELLPGVPHVVPGDAFARVGGGASEERASGRVPDPFGVILALARADRGEELLVLEIVHALGEPRFAPVPVRFSGDFSRAGAEFSHALGAVNGVAGEVVGIEILTPHDVGGRVV